MQTSQRLAWLALGLIVGCSTNNRIDPGSPPIVGTWILDAARTSPMAATNPALAGSFAITMTYSPDGAYRYITNFSGHAQQSDGKWRMVSSDIYTDFGNGEHQQLYEIRGNELLIRDRHEPGVLVFKRQR